MPIENVAHHDAGLFSPEEAADYEVELISGLPNHGRQHARHCLGRLPPAHRWRQAAAWQLGARNHCILWKGAYAREHSCKDRDVQGRCCYRVVSWGLVLHDGHHGDGQHDQQCNLQAPQACFGLMSSAVESRICVWNGNRHCSYGSSRLKGVHLSQASAHSRGLCSPGIIRPAAPKRPPCALQNALVQDRAPVNHLFPAAASTVMSRLSPWPSSA